MGPYICIYIFCKFKEECCPLAYYWNASFEIYSFGVFISIGFANARSYQEWI
jgi:hypothetical protein